MSEVVDLLERPVYGLAQVDRLLALNSGTAKRWIEGYERSGTVYPPVVRVEPTGRDLVTWGEFVEVRLLKEYRDAGIPVNRMRPAIDALRAEFKTPYPLAMRAPFLTAAGRELVNRVEEAVGLARVLRLTVVRNGQAMMSDEVVDFVSSSEFDSEADDAFVRSLRPVTDIQQVTIDPLRQFGEPVVRSVPTEVIAEQLRAGESIEAIAELNDLTSEQVQAAVRFELVRSA